MSLRAIDLPGTARDLLGKSGKCVLWWRSVKSHFVHIFSKLGVADRTAAVIEAVKKEDH